jgi:AcrR family transcriptional regulator
MGTIPRADSRWRKRSAERATEDVRKKAEARSDRFLQIALDLLSEGGAENLSVRKVVELSGLSLRSFYQSFSGTDDLFLAIYEEATLGGLERQLDAVTAAGSDPLDRLRAFMEAEWIASSEAPPLLQRSLVTFHQRLSETRPTELAALLEPEHRALVELLRDCRLAGMSGPGLNESTTASILLHLLMDLLQAKVLGFHVGGAEVTFEEFWDLLQGVFTAPNV